MKVTHGDQDRPAVVVTVDPFAEPVPVDEAEPADVVDEVKPKRPRRPREKPADDVAG